MGKFKALRTSFKASKSFSVKNRLEYFVGYQPHVLVPTSTRRDMDFGETGGGDSYDYQNSRPLPDDQGSSSSSSSSSYPSSETSTVMMESELNSLAQDSVDVRRSTNPSLIRSNSVVLIEGLPETISDRDLRIWISHSASAQFIDIRKPSSAYARFGSRRERDFFLQDFANTQLRIKGILPQVRALSTDECLDYFEEERDRRRSLIGSMGPPESWCRQRSSACSPDPPQSHTSTIPTIPGWAPRPGTNMNTGVAFTDTVAGNPGLGEPGSSILYGIKRGRQIAKSEFREIPKNFFQDDFPDENIVINTRKRELPDCGLSEIKEDLKRTKTSPRLGKKKTRRGRRGGQRKHVFGVQY